MISIFINNYPVQPRHKKPLATRILNVYYYIGASIYNLYYVIRQVNKLFCNQIGSLNFKTVWCLTTRQVSLVTEQFSSFQLNREWMLQSESGISHTWAIHVAIAAQCTVLIAWGGPRASSDVSWLSEILTRGLEGQKL